VKKITRRSAIWSMAVSSSLAYGRDKATAFALIGDRYHNSDYIRTGLGKTLGQDPAMSIDFYDDVKLLNAEELKGYKLLIILRDGMLWPNGYPDAPPGISIVSDPLVPKVESTPFYWITPAQGKAVKDFVSSGGAALLFHNVGYISPHDDDFRDVLGAVTQSHPPIRPFKVKVTNKEHPITQGVNDFVVTDEQHYLTYQKDPKYLLLQSVNEDGLDFRGLGNTSAAGWAYAYGKGRVCYLAPGHLLTALWNPEYVKLQKNAVRWLLRKS
jgi:type 1 glutamine amidotransferase